MGKVERTTAVQCQRNRQPLPKAIRNAPELFLGLEFVWNSFWQLSTCRPIGFGMGHIPYSTIVDFCLTHDMDEQDTADFVHLIQAMDRGFVDYNNAEVPKEAKDKGK